MNNETPIPSRPPTARFCKPTAICLPPVGPTRGDPREVCAAQQALLELRVLPLGLTIVRGRLEDEPRLDAAYGRCFGGDGRTSAWQRRAALGFGGSAMIEDEQGELRGFHLEIGYQDADQTSYSLGVGVDAALRGNGLAHVLATYTALGAMRRGARTRRGIVHPGNLPSVITLLNRVGCVSEDFHPCYADFGEPRITYCLALTAGAVVGGSIDPARLNSALSRWQEGLDYHRVAHTDIETLARVHAEGYRLVAVTPKNGGHRGQVDFIALHLGLLPAVDAPESSSGTATGMS